MNILGTFSLALVLSFTISVTNADKNPTGLPLGYYPTYTPSYWKKPASYYRKCVPKDTSNDVITLPDRNGGRPYHNCRYQIRTLEGLFFRANEIYYPCKTPEVLGVQYVGEPFHKSFEIMNGVQEAVATKLPLPIPESTTDNSRPNSVPVTGGVLTEAFVFLKNTSVPYLWEKDENFNIGIQQKIRLLKETSKLYRDTQLELLMSLHQGLSNSVANAQIMIQNQNQNRNQNDRRDAAPYIVTDFQSFSTPTTRTYEESLREDYIKAERTFGIAGTRFEFQDPKKVSDRIVRLTNSRVANIDVGNLGNNPQDASRNTVNMHQNYFDLHRKVDNDLENHLQDLAGKMIPGHNHFNFKVPALQLPVCNEEIEVDPEGITPAGSMKSQTGMGHAMF